MKNLIKLLPGFLLLTTLLFSCKKEENKVYFEGGTAPVLTASSTANMVLNSANFDKVALVFNWTNPDYKFNTGISSQDVTYILQVDTTGSNFTNPKMQEVAISKELRYSPTVKEFNAFFNKMELKYGQAHNIEFRVKAALANGTAAAIYSNVVKIVVTPYLDVAIPISSTGELYITGSGVASGWTNNPPATQKFTQISVTEYTISINLLASAQIKFLTKLTFWQPQYGLKTGTNGDASGGELGLNDGSGIAPYNNDPTEIPTPSVAGMYKITVNFITGRYKVEKI